MFAFRMGVGGAGAATCLSNWLVFGYYINQYARCRKTTAVNLCLRTYSLKHAVASAVLSVGVPAGLVLFLTNICDFVRNYYLGSLGSDIELAAWGAVQKISNALIMICVGIAQGVRPLLAYHYACGQHVRTRSLMSGAVVVMLGYTAVALLLVHLFPKSVVRLFVMDDNAVEAAVFFLEVWTYATIGIGMLELYNAAFQAFGKWQVSLANILINKGCLLTPVLILLVRLMGIQGIAYRRLITGSLTAAALTVIYLRMARGLKADESLEAPAAPAGD